jgi:SAM-dependent methyltransferase
VKARLYDAGARRSRSLEADRSTLLAEAQGRVLEIGAGTGLNARHYPHGVDVVYTEPDPAMALRVPVVAAAAEELPFDDGSFDTVVSTLVLCSVSDLEQAIAEIRRVLASDGRLLFLEHVRAEEGSRLARWQDRLNPAWRAFAGCDCNRRTVDALARVFRLEVRSARFAPPFAHPVFAGVARSLS